MNIATFIKCMISYGFYCLGICFVFVLLITAFSFVTFTKNTDLDVYLDKQKDGYGNMLPERKYIIYKNKRYYLGQDLKVYTRFNKYYVIIGNRRFYINY